MGEQVMENASREFDRKAKAGNNSLHNAHVSNKRLKPIKLNLYF
jgi:hypothetical protein